MFLHSTSRTAAAIALAGVAALWLSVAAARGTELLAGCPL